MVNLSEEMKDPGKNLPKAILFAIGISTLFYVLTAISAVSVVGWQALGQTNAPLAIVAEKALGGNAGLILSIIALASTANTVLVLLLASSRIMHAMARAGVLPGILSVISSNRQTPWLTVLVGGLIAVLLALVSDIQQIAEFTNFITLLAFAGVNAAAVRLLSEEKGINKSRRIWLNRVFPILGIIVSLWLAINTGWQAAIFGSIIVLAGLIVFLASRPRPKTARS